MDRRLRANDSLDNVPTPSLTLASNKSGTLSDPSKSLTEVLSSADEGGVERGLVDVMLSAKQSQPTTKS